MQNHYIEQAHCNRCLGDTDHLIVEVKEKQIHIETVDPFSFNNREEVTGRDLAHSGAEIACALSGTRLALLS